jgi:hypothetical protein
MTRRRGVHPDIAGRDLSKKGGTMKRTPALIASVLSFAVVASALVLLVHVQPHTVRSNRSLSGVSACNSAPGAASSTVDLQVASSTDDFSQSCYYAAADESLTVTFTNSVFASADNAPTTLTLLISPTAKPAIWKTSNGFLAIDETRAAFVGSPVVAPDTGSFSIPPLQAGTYLIQVLEMPSNFSATLVVE